MFLRFSYFSKKKKEEEEEEYSYHEHEVQWQRWPIDAKCYVLVEHEDWHVQQHDEQQDQENHWNLISKIRILKKRKTKMNSQTLLSIFAMQLLRIEREQDHATNENQVQHQQAKWSTTTTTKKGWKFVNNFKKKKRKEKELLCLQQVHYQLLQALKEASMHDEHLHHLHHAMNEQMYAFLFCFI